jgi:hypothetical protein
MKHLLLIPQFHTSPPIRYALAVQRWETRDKSAGQALVSHPETGNAGLVGTVITICSPVRECIAQAEVTPRASAAGM